MIYIVIALAIVVLFLLVHRPTKERVKQVSSDVVGVCAVALERTSQKEARKARVLELLQENDEITLTPPRDINYSKVLGGG